VTRLDPLTSRIVADRILVRDGRVRRVPFFARLFSFTELRDWLLAAGFLQVDGYGEDGEPLSAASRRMVAVARCRPPPAAPCQPPAADRRRPPGLTAADFAPV
jgi:hypothetical protein